MRYNTLQALADREWILTNGIGGYALGFGNMTNKRKYNGLLVSSSRTFKRMHILATIEEKLESENTYFFLDSNNYKNCIYPSGHNHIVKMWLRPYPCVLYSSDPFDKNYLITKEIFMLQGKNAVTVKYSNVAETPINLTLRPKFSLRSHHYVNKPGLWDYTRLEKETYSNVMHIKRPDNDCEAYVFVEKGEMIDTNIVYQSVYYPLEILRGYESTEDLISPLRIELPLSPGESSLIVFSSEPLEDPISAGKEAERYYKQYPLPSSHPDKKKPASLLDQGPHGEFEFDGAAYRKILEMAVRDFIVEGEDIIAGYPWFGPWSRDTLISMGALEYLPEGPDIALKILKKYGSHLNRGMIPNTFGEGGTGLNYESVDAPLWYILRCRQYAPKDKTLFEHVSHIILNYLHDELHPFSIGDDGLIEIREGSHALTWMDAKIYDSPVTPRFGKPVEINALWFNALLAAREMAEENEAKNLSSGSYACSLHELDALIEKAKHSLQKFVGDDYLADRLEKNVPIWEVRPNAVTALSLPADFVDVEVIKKVWVKAKEELLTPYGLRSLSPKHPAFKQKYIGNQKQRDLAYHQGTAWAYLLLPFVRLSLKALAHVKAKKEILKEVSGYIWALRNGFMKGEMASVAEIWDGMDPYFPKGCPAQAWSTFALFEIEGILMKGQGIKK